MDLSKAYDCLPHDLLIAKVEAYGLDNLVLIWLMITYVFGNKGKKIGSLYSDSANVTRGIPKRSILGPLLSNIFINDIFLFIEKSDICKFADDNTLFSCGDNLSVILKSLEHAMKILLRWFKFTYSESGKVSNYGSSEIPTVRKLSYNRSN